MENRQQTSGSQAPDHSQDGPHLGEAQGSSGTSNYGRSADPVDAEGRNDQLSDERIRAMICERLHDDPTIDARDVSVQVEDGNIELEGTVESRGVKNAIEDVANQLGLQEVHNNLEVQENDVGP